MYDPETTTFQSIQQAMASGDMTGHNRPVARVSFQKRRIRRHRSNRPGPWRNLLFPWSTWIEGPAVNSLTINRSLDSDAATATIVFVNDYMRRDVFDPQGIDTGIGRPGYFTPDRGEPSPVPQESVYDGPEGKFPTDWDYPYAGFGNSPSPSYYKLFQPNRLLFTYQGYGSDNFNDFGQARYVHSGGYVPPWEDSKLLQTGTWLIDSVNFGSDGFITVECRDTAKLLLEQYVYPPMIPLERFPLQYCPVTVTETSTTQVSTATTTLGGSSNDVWLGWNASVYGHRPSHAFDGKNDTYWLSIGNSGPSHSWSYEWIQGKVSGSEIDRIVVNPIYAGMTGYISVREGGTWQGANTVPYDPNAGPSFPNGANIPYVKKVTNMPKGSQTIVLPRTYAASDIRICFTKLGNSGLGTYPYRAGVRRFQARLSTETTTITTDEGEPGVIGDWSAAIKELVSWAGLTWHDSVEPEDQLLGRTTSDNKPLRAWGDFERLGAGPIECTPASFFLNKSFMEAITQIKDFLGCVFFIDHNGGAIFRHPNIFSGGNFLTDPFGTTPFTRDTHIATVSTEYSPYIAEWPIELHENSNLLDYSVTINDSQLRSEILVVGESPDIESAMPAGGIDLVSADTDGTINFRDVLAGQTRMFQVPGDATKLFRTEAECQRMAEMTALFILFTYRRASSTALAHPGLQLDDQIRIYERITNERNIHYVSAITTRFDAESGEYLMDLTTHWLGGDPDTQWFLDELVLTDGIRDLPRINARLATHGG